MHGLWTYLYLLRSNAKSYLFIFTLLLMCQKFLGIILNVIINKNVSYSKIIFY